MSPAPERQEDSEVPGPLSGGAAAKAANRAAGPLAEARERWHPKKKPEQPPEPEGQDGPLAFEEAEGAKPPGGVWTGLTAAAGESEIDAHSNP